MILIGIGMLVTGILLGACLIYLWTRPKPAPLPEPAQPPTVPQDVERIRALQRRDEDEVFDRMGEFFDRMDDVFDGWLGVPVTRRQPWGGGLFQTRTTTVTRTPVTPEVAPVQPPVAQPPAQPPVTLFDHLAKDDEPT